MIAFRQAVEKYRTDVLEIDVHATRDGVLVVHHDSSVDRCTDGVGAIATMTFEEIARLDAAHRFSTVGGATFPHRARGVRIARFREVLDAFPVTRLNVELKAEPPVPRRSSRLPAKKGTAEISNDAATAGDATIAAGFPRVHERRSRSSRAPSWICWRVR